MRVDFKYVTVPNTFETIYAIYIDNTLLGAHMSPETFRDFGMGRFSDPVGEMTEILWNEIHDERGIEAACKQDSVKGQLTDILTKINEGMNK